MHALFAYGTYLAEDHEFTKPSISVDVLGEALDIARDLSMQDVGKYSEFFVCVAVGYSNALENVHRGAKALETSTEAISRSRSLVHHDPEQSEVLADALHLHCIHIWPISRCLSIVVGIRGYLLWPLRPEP